jgi:hypothetical protein
LKLKFNKGVSNVVGVMIILMVLVAVAGIVFAVTYNIVTKSTEESGACFDVLDKVSIDPMYTCYIPPSYGNEKLNLFISVGNIEIEGILVSLSGNKITETFEILKTGTTIDYLENNAEVYPPEKNSGLVYQIMLFSFSGPSTNTRVPDKIEIAPIINGQQCGVSDRILEIPECD